VSKLNDKRIIPIARPLIGDEEIKAVIRVLKSGMLAQGKEVEMFEKEFAEYIGVDYAVAVCNGTVALDLALKCLEIRPGDEVITTPFTFIASANCILFQGARPVFADINERTFNIDPDSILEKITDRTKAIIPVHLYGHPAEMSAIMEIAEDHKLYVIEDCAQAHGAEYRGKKVGSIGTAGCFSFYPTKNMTTGEGGMITTNDRKIYNKAKLLRDHGQTRKYHHEILGYNYRMTNIAAAMGRVQLKKLEMWLKIRERNAKILINEIRKIRGLIPPYVEPHVRHAWHQFVIRVTNEFPLTRDELAHALENHGIQTAIHYPKPIHLQPLYQNLGYDKNECPAAIKVSKEVLSLPVHPAVSLDDIKYMVKTLRELATGK